MLLYINDLNQTIKFCKVHHFADDTNLLCLSNSIKKLNKLVNANLKHPANWLNANKISLSIMMCYLNKYWGIPNKIKTIVSDFYLKSLITQGSYKNYIYDFISSYIIGIISNIAYVRFFCLLHYFLSSDSDAMTH